MTSTAEPTTPTKSRKELGLRSERGPILLAVMLATGLVAIDSTIIATAVPAVVGDLGGFSQFPWLFSIYLLTQAVSVPIYGKLSDTLGRRPIMLVGIGLFLLGSVLCGFAWSMPALIAFRAVQGLGAGAVQPISMTIIGDLYTVEERAKVQGYVASVWGVSSVLGPTLGGVFSDYLSWRWIFFVNIPLGAYAVWVFWRRFSESGRAPSRHRIDYLGAGVLAAASSILIIAVLEGGVAWAWGSAVSVTLFVLAVLGLAAFVLVERHAEEPVLPMWVLRRRILAGGNVASFAVGALLIGLTSYVPTLAQGVYGTGAVVAGFALAALTLGWPVAAANAGRVYTRIGFRDCCLIGCVAVVGGAVWLVLLPRSAGVGELAAACFVTGLGMGFVASPSLIAVQSVVDWSRRGVVTGTNMFFRSMGSAIGAALFGLIANHVLADRFAHPPAGVVDLPDSADATSLVLGGHHAGGAVADFVRDSLYLATHGVFWAVLASAVLMVVGVALLPRHTSPIE
ncbi:MDR family MFS transporter [Jatrophihabitans sp. YIM 134969]